MITYEVSVFYGTEGEHQKIIIKSADRQMAVMQAATVFWHDKKGDTTNVNGFAVREIEDNEKTNDFKNGA
ncbi:MAG: hypothetical protein EHM25_00310 [Nitrosopumilales archaeon]|nr:MAG: hypothetical protein EHM25_00310 [Nitrosopumilales archaeon]